MLQIYLWLRGIKIDSIIFSQSLELSFDKTRMQHESSSNSHARSRWNDFFFCYVFMS